MEKSPSFSNNRASYALDTNEFAARNHVKAHSVRARVSTTGSYFGVFPKKLVNGRLVWPDVQVEATK